MTAPHLGILVGYAGEARLLATRGRSSALKTTILVSGADSEMARVASRQLADSATTHLLSFGLAGGLDPRLRPGTVLLPSGGMTPDGDRYAVDALWHRRAANVLAELAPDFGAIFGADSAIASAAEKGRLYHSAACIAVDMESHVLAAAAARHGKPVLILRVVADPAAASLPEAARVAITRDGSLDMVAILRSLTSRPAQLPSLIRLALDSSAARRSLLRCVGLGGDSGFGMM